MKFKIDPEKDFDNSKIAVVNSSTLERCPLHGEDSIYAFIVQRGAISIGAKFQYYCTNCWIGDRLVTELEPIIRRYA